MKSGIAQKLIRTYVVIIAATIISGTFCLYVLAVNLRTNSEMRYVALPSLEHLKEMRSLMQEIKKLSNTWVYIASNRNNERLTKILNVEYPALDSSLHANISKWDNKEELMLFDKIHVNEQQIIDSIKEITQLLNTPASYADDSIADRASSLNTRTGKQITYLSKLYTELIKTKESNLVKQQNLVGSLLDSLYIIVLLTIVIVIVVSYISAQYSKKNVVKPLLRLNRTILDMAIGEVNPISVEGRDDEIGQMHVAVDKMIDGIVQKINFAEQIGKENYEAEFTLLSEKDKLGLALLTMRNNLKESKAQLLEQDKRLINAQELARIGNYFYDIEAGTLQTSRTLDDVLGIDKHSKQKIDWKRHVLPEFHAEVSQKAIRAIKERTKLELSYIIKRQTTGEECWVNAIGEYNYNADGRAVSVFGTIQDISAQKKLETELNTSYKLAQAQNNKLLNFSYIVSHNLRMHAVNIQSLLELIQDAKSEEEEDELMGYLRTASGQLNETMFHLNSVVAIQSAVNIERQSLVLHEYINRTIDLLKTKTDCKNGQIINNVRPDIVVRYNSIYLDSILLNFLSNAIKYSHPERTPMVIVNFHEENNAGILEIADNGLGIDLEKNREKLFGMYKTFHGNEDAQGIGLFMSKYQIEAMGGSVTVESKVNAGTTFRIYMRGT